MHAHDIVREFGALAKLPEFALDDRGMARMQLDSTIIIDFEHDATNDVLHLYSSIAPAPDDCTAQLKLLMEANLFLDRSVGTTFALDSITGEFMCCLRLEPEKMSAADLVKHVERMADAVERLRADLDGLEEPAEPAPLSAIDLNQLRMGPLRG
ncbi:type III secretion system chaperone|uniref:type III secretion system chaperone n=1 Tax=Noviherbaspirillum sp. L7-7A TaxID=2850560 RepID=UPI001C2C793A|nr:type III secretion system chaperone [Noviherbaspirillum sp. L7-7A]MBV0878022.1 type III secretion system chaperone [Noviherbaspirillum sp. L7-7A]